jgi:hypothetical protein
MPNILTVPASGIISFDSRTGTDFNLPNLENSVRIAYDSNGGLNINSYVTGVSGVERFSIDGTNGRLFSVTDSLSGLLFSVNDIAGLPIIEAFDNDTVIMGAYNRNDFIITGNSVGIGAIPNTGTSKLYISGGNLRVDGGIFLSGAPVISASNLQRFITGMSTGIDSYTGNFTNTFSTVPVVVATMETTGVYGYVVNLTQITTSGFVVDFSDVIRESGVDLNIIAYG